MKSKSKITRFFLFFFVMAACSNCLAQADDHSGHNTSAGDSTKTGAVSYYTCPMHPEIQSTFPATCPKCGMTLIQKNSSSPEEKMNMMMCPMHGMTDMNHNHDGDKKNKKKMMMGTGVMGVMMVVMMALMIAGGAVFLMGR